MDYQYSGSASYPRFDREICQIVKVFGGVETKELRERREKEVEGSLDYWFGFLSAGDREAEKFVFPKETPTVLVEWFNHLYDILSPDETLEVWELFSLHPEIKEISSQLWHELKTLAELGGCWSIC